MPSVRSVSVGIWIGTGSRYESDSQAGLSHLLEHLLFKGTDRYESVQIDQLFDGMGAELNAGTGKETTSVYARVIDEHLPAAFDVMADMVFRPRVGRDRLRARGDPRRDRDVRGRAPGEGVRPARRGDRSAATRWGGRSSARAEVISGTPRDQIAAFHTDRYRPERHRDRRRRRDRARRVRVAVRRTGARRGERLPAARPAPTVPARRCGHESAVRAQGHRAVPRLPGRPRASPATTTVGSRCALLDYDVRRHVVLAPVPRDPRASAGSPTRSTRSRPPTTTPARSASTSAPVRTTCSEALSVVGTELAHLRVRAGDCATSCVAPRRTSRAVCCWRWNRPGRG